MTVTKIEHPLMYKGFLIKQEGNKLSANNLHTGICLAPIFSSFESIKVVIDEINEKQ